MKVSLDPYIRALLNAWGRFRRDGWNPRLGYDSVNILHKTPGGDDGEEVPENVILIDKFIFELPCALRDALKQTYLHRRSLRIAGKKMEMSKDSFNTLLCQAEQRVAGYLSAVEEQRIA